MASAMFVQAITTLSGCVTTPSASKARGDQVLQDRGQSLRSRGYHPQSGSLVPPRVPRVEFEPPSAIQAHSEKGLALTPFADAERLIVEALDHSARLSMPSGNH